MHRLVLLLLIFSADSALAQEFYFLGGATRDSNSGVNTYGWALEYQQELGAHAAFSLSWLNEGHVPGHHRDGQSAQLWGVTDLAARRLSIAAGIGPYRYFDTAIAGQGGAYSDDHGWGTITSLAATWHPRGRWNIQLRAQHIETATDFDSTAILLGFGYQLSPTVSPGSTSVSSLSYGPKLGNEIALFVGRTVVNSGESENAIASAIEYRRSLRPHMDWTVGWLNEGDPRLIRRDGLITQLWLTGSFEGNRLGLGAGLGPYLAVDKRRRPQSGESGNEALATLVSMTASYRFQPRWLVRFLWNRVATDYSRDSDVFLIGMGYRF